MVSRRRNANFDFRRRVRAAQGNHSDRDPPRGLRKFWFAETYFLWPCTGEAQIWPPETRYFISTSYGRYCGLLRIHPQRIENRHDIIKRRQKLEFQPHLKSASQYEIAKKKSNHTWMSTSQYEIRNWLRWEPPKRRRNTNFDLRRCIFLCPHHMEYIMDYCGFTTRGMKIATVL